MEGHQITIVMMLIEVISTKIMGIDRRSIRILQTKKIYIIEDEMKKLEDIFKLGKIVMTSKIMIAQININHQNN